MIEGYDKSKKKLQPVEDDIEPGMQVEASEGDLGEQDVSKPTVTDVVRDQHGQVEKVIVQKGVIFKKELKVPADRVHVAESNEGEADGGSSGKVIIDAGETELEATSAGGVEQLATEREAKRAGLLDEVEEAIP